ncbi:hypothetical protein MYP_1099 [Sporocytophaga myxococcoides]|uniref:DUF2809 domain-containing protein n=1 Tax=Sporocytophaga myxococcoides TaxID=153721 RepID=A0A098LAC0_9BACT|nr:DUF2809 domain-containing protein [Sporocytophaga myxococcoides]GAL83871.1 hypothetical protein MYP_1099 [Sporocytophaga myxococcoides]
MKRNRVLYFFIIIGLIGIGLAARKWKIFLPDLINVYLGDAIWAAMIYFGIAFIFNRKSLSFIGVLSLTFCYCIEVSQFYHAPWIDAIRNTRIGALILGFAFLWSDILAYTLGIGFSFLGEYFFFKGKPKEVDAVA